MGVFACHKGIAMKNINLSQGLVALVDDEDFERVRKYNWHISSGGEGLHYARGWVEGEHILLHRFIMHAKKGQRIDHKNHNTLHNYKTNLRRCTHGQNIANSVKRSGTSKYKGVTSEKGRWRVTVGIKGKTYHLGCFQSEIIAGLIYDAHAKKTYGEFAHLNFPNYPTYKGVNL